MIYVPALEQQWAASIGLKGLPRRTLDEPPLALKVSEGFFI